MEITNPRHLKEEIWYERNFKNKQIKIGWAGFSFSCDKEGNLIPSLEGDKINQIRLENFNDCLKHPEDFQDEGVKEKRRSYYTNAEGICECGKTIELYNEYLGACECPFCGTWHNLFGQVLTNPEEWNKNDDW